MEKTTYLDWAVILAGAFVACAVSTVLVQFGAVVGLTYIEPGLTADQNITPVGVFGAGLWLLWVQMMASIGGGYLAGRMRQPIPGATEHERDMRDGVHGLIVWAVSTVAVVLAASAAASVAAIADNNVTEEVAAIADVNAMEDNVTIIFAFFAASASLISAVLSWWAATVGGDHRDTGVDHTRYFTFRVLR